MAKQANSAIKAAPKQWAWALWPSLFGIALGLLLIQWQSEKTVEHSFADAVVAASPSVVSIHTSTRTRQQAYHPFLRDPLLQANTPTSSAIASTRPSETNLGSAVIINEQGYLLTNYHVIKGADEILALLYDGRRATAELVGSDAETDLAVLKIALPDLQAMRIASEPRVGDAVLAIGNPYGFGQTVTQGILSATGRYGFGLSRYENFLQTDASINPGNSGGALVDHSGALLGINTAIYTDSGNYTGIGLAIPADLAVATMKDLIQHGRAQRGWLGLRAAAVVQGNSTALEVKQVSRNGPADIAGISPGDIIVSIGGEAIRSGYMSFRKVADTRPGKQLRLQILRENEIVDIVLEVGLKPVISP